MGRWKTAVTNEDGELLAVLDSREQAAEYARQAGFDEVLGDWGPRGPVVPEQNPLGALGPRRSWEALDFLRVTMEQVQRISVEEAWRRLRTARMYGISVIPGGPRRDLVELDRDRTQYMFPRFRGQVGKRQRVKRGRSATEMAREWLTTNAKLTKDHPAAKTKVTGLSLLPADYPRRGLLDERLADYPGQRLPVLRPGRRVNMCVGANAECSSSCLVYSGQNASDPYNSLLKEAKTAAFFYDPPAFCRLLLESCRKWFGTWATQGRRRATKHPFVRLNVFSDVPWELVFPELFIELQGGTFYDYTKVPARPEQCVETQREVAGRRPSLHVFPFPLNYDLTFSVSGTNDQDVYDELAAGRRVAVVFNTGRHQLPAFWKPPFWREPMPVVDGDLSDVRPFDPSWRALTDARAELGWPDASASQEERIRHSKRVTRRAYRLAWGPSGAPARWAVYDCALNRWRRTVEPPGPVIVGLTYKAPSKAAAQAKAETARVSAARARGDSPTKRAFLVPVVIQGDVVIGESQAETVTWEHAAAVVSALTPRQQPGVGPVVRAAKRTKKRKK